MNIATTTAEPLATTSKRSVKPTKATNGVQATDWTTKEVFLDCLSSYVTARERWLTAVKAHFPGLPKMPSKKLQQAVREKLVKWATEKHVESYARQLVSTAMLSLGIRAREATSKAKSDPRAIKLSQATVKQYGAKDACKVLQAAYRLALAQAKLEAKEAKEEESE